MSKRIVIVLGVLAVMAGAFQFVAPIPVAMAATCSSSEYNICQRDCIANMPANCVLTSVTCSEDQLSTTCDCYGFCTIFGHVSGNPEGYHHLQIVETVE